MERDEYREHVQSFGDALRAKLRADRAGLLDLVEKRMVGEDKAEAEATASEEECGGDEA